MPKFPDAEPDRTYFRNLAEEMIKKFDEVCVITDEVSLMASNADSQTRNDHIGRYITINNAPGYIKDLEKLSKILISIKGKPDNQAKLVALLQLGNNQAISRHLALQIRNELKELIRILY